MLTRIFDLKIINFSISALIVLGAIVCIYTPNYFLLKMGARFAGIIMLGYLFMGLFFLTIRQSGLMLTSFICCGGLCLFLKNTSTADLRHPLRTSDNIVTVAHFNISSGGDQAEETVNTILASKADLISIQDVTPEWQYVLSESLSEQYPYHTSIVRLDPYGLAVFSKYPISALDTFHTGDIPNLHGKVMINEESIDFVAAHTIAPLYSGAYTEMQEQITMIGEKAKEITNPLFIMGNFNAPPWWGEIQNLRSNGSLNDSRVSSTYGFTDVFQSPTDYIFFSNQLNCVGFHNLFSENNSQVGIAGTYQLK